MMTLPDIKVQINMNLNTLISTENLSIYETLSKKCYDCSDDVFFEMWLKMGVYQKVDLISKCPDPNPNPNPNPNPIPYTCMCHFIQDAMQSNWNNLFSSRVIDSISYWGKLFIG